MRINKRFTVVMALRGDVCACFWLNSHGKGTCFENGNHNKHRQHRPSGLPCAYPSYIPELKFSGFQSELERLLNHGRNGDVDVVLTHDPAAEDKFMAESGVNRRQVMYNDFVLIGPANDPAGIKGKPITEAMATIAKKESPLQPR